MSRDSKVVVLGVLTRLSGAQCVREVDSLVERESKERPQIVGKAIAQHGKSDSFVRSMVIGIDLPNLLVKEIKRREGAA